MDQPTYGAIVNAAFIRSAPAMTWPKDTRSIKAHALAVSEHIQGIGNSHSDLTIFKDYAHGCYRVIPYIDVSMIPFEPALQAEFRWVGAVKNGKWTKERDYFKWEPQADASDYDEEGHFIGDPNAPPVTNLRTLDASECEFDGTSSESEVDTDSDESDDSDDDDDDQDPSQAERDAERDGLNRSMCEQAAPIPHSTGNVAEHIATQNPPVANQNPPVANQNPPVANQNTPIYDWDAIRRSPIRYPVPPPMTQEDLDSCHRHLEWLLERDPNFLMGPTTPDLAIFAPVGVSLWVKRTHLAWIRKLGHIPRPRNAWILYRTNMSKRMRAQFPGITASQISRLVGQLWKLESLDVRQQYVTLANEEARRHALIFPEYKYRPRPAQEKRRRLFNSATDMINPQ